MRTAVALSAVLVVAGCGQRREAVAEAAAGPWSISSASNLTPDENTGMGIWTKQMSMDD